MVDHEGDSSPRLHGRPDVSDEDDADLLLELAEERARCRACSSPITVVAAGPASAARADGDDLIACPGGGTHLRVRFHGDRFPDVAPSAPSPRNGPATVVEPPS